MELNKVPLVTVLMSVFNNASFIKEAAESILNQSYTNFEFLIINDGSTDKSFEIIKQYKDSRIRVIENKENIGLTRSLRRGVEMSQGEYIARMDADDVSHPIRLEKQVALLEKKPYLGILGTECKRIDEKGKVLGILHSPNSDLEIRWTSLIDNPFAHSSVMIRRKLLLQFGLNYQDEFLTAQDYDLWTRLLNHSSGANIKEPLVSYRIRNGISKTRRNEQLTSQTNIAFRTIYQYFPGLGLTKEDVCAVCEVFTGYEKNRCVYNENYVRATEIFLDLFIAFSRGNYDEKELSLLRQKVAVRAAFHGLCSPIEASKYGLLKRLLFMEPALPLLIIKRIIEKSITRISYKK